MAGLRPHLEQGPENHLAGVDIIGGTFVMPGTGGTAGKVILATAALNDTVLGLAIGDAAAVAGQAANTNDPWGRPVGGVLTPPNEVAVAYRGSWWLKNSSGAPFTYGQLLTVANGGILTALGAAAAVDARTIVARCIEPAGVANLAEGRFRLLLG